MAWGWLKGLGAIGAGVAAPFTGGASLSALGPLLAGGAGAAMSGGSQQAASNRGAKFDGQLDLQQLLMARDGQAFDQNLRREQEGRASGTDAWRKLMAAERVGNPGARPQLSPYSVAPRQAAESELYGADALRAEALKRLTGGNQLPMPQQSPMQVDPSLLNAGGLETAGNWLGPLLSFLGRPQEKK